jgi:hypothetical protein
MGSKRLFDGIEMQALELADVRTVDDDGVIVQLSTQEWAGEG